MTDDQLASIEGMLSAGAIEVRYGREYDPSIVRALVAEVRQLRDRYADLVDAAREVRTPLTGKLCPAESMALAVGLAQVQRGEAPLSGVASMCVLALARLDGRHDWTLDEGVLGDDDE